MLRLRQPGGSAAAPPREEEARSRSAEDAGPGEQARAAVGSGEPLKVAAPAAPPSPAAAKVVVAQPRKFNGRMTAAQELANALTQVFPSLYYAHVAWSRGFAFAGPTWVLLAAVWLHLPVSFTYHCRCALLAEVDPIGDTWRRLDNTCIHLAAACIAHATSFGRQAGFSLAVGAFNVFAASLHWLPEINQPRNQLMTGIAVLLYVLPIAYRADFDNLAGALATFLPSGICFKTYYFGGYSHSIFHLGMALFAVFLLNSVLEAEIDHLAEWAGGAAHPAERILNATLG